MVISMLMDDFVFSSRSRESLVFFEKQII